MAMTMNGEATLPASKDVVWAKLAALAEGARIASREFWG